MHPGQSAVRAAIAVFSEGASGDTVESWVLNAVRPTTRRDYASALRALREFLERHPPPPQFRDLDQAVAALLHERATRPDAVSHSGLSNTLSGLRWAANNLGIPLTPKLRLHDSIVRALPVADSFSETVTFSSKFKVF